jgi:peptide/nickel transport system ATP-binding protein
VSVPRPLSGAPTEPLLELRDLYVEYLTPRGAVGAVDGVSFAIAPGEVFGLAGESGCGKSTIAHSILRVLRPPAVITGGQILFRGQDVLEMDADALQSFRWRDVSMVFQSALNALNPVTQVKDQIADVIVHHERIAKSAAYERAATLLETVGIERSRMNAYPHELSGGMRQRVVIAIALALKPPLMIMDEPTTALDVVVQKDILQQIERLKQELGFSILFITHDLSLMVEFSDRIGIMYAGKLVELAPARQILDQSLNPYTQGLLSSFPPLVGEKTKLTGIPGAPPDLAAPPSGCRFHPRCPRAVARCREVAPALRQVRPQHWVACDLVEGEQA